MCCVVVKECVNPVTVEALNADVDKQQITRFNRPDMLSPRTLIILCSQPYAHRTCGGLRWRILNGVQYFYELLI
jgi:hypothetical protein